MVGPAFDCLLNPLGAVRLSFERAVSASDRFDPASLSNKDWGAVDVFQKFLFDEGGLSQVPFLDTENQRWIQPNSLVRFRGMVQDMLGSEFYVGAFKDGPTWRTNKFADVSSVDMGPGPEMQIWERSLLYCVQVPGQNSWSVQSYSSSPLLDRYKAMSSTQHGEKRPRHPNVEDMESNGSNSELGGTSSCSKKKREEELPSLVLQASHGSHGHVADISMVPDFNTKSLSCLVKIYDSLESDLKLNDVVEFIGVFTFDPELVVHKTDSDELMDGLCDDALAHLPPSKVPRLHCLIHRKLALQDFLIGSHVTEPKPSLIRGIRETLLRHLTSILGNDGVAAQCMVLHLLSRVHARVDSVAVGKLSLNLCGLNAESVAIFVSRLNLVIQSILPFSQCIPLTVEYLNTTTLAPRKDYQSNRLITGALQLVRGSHLTFDETRLISGTLNSVGVANVRLLKNLMECQQVEYEFDYYKMEMPADVQLLILSEGKSSILPADLVLPFRPVGVTYVKSPTEEDLQAWRWYLVTLRSLSHVIEPEMQKVLEDDMVAARQGDRTLGAADFSRWMTMARLMTASFGETNLSLEHWQMVKELERLRKERLK
ncbi:mini-chromosome maintenance complex-binding protein [Aristolochia californica]|uniref:mini-chromosome maintenance complex-binding protein n=1 Tax=Aristolochia californica TaxID=171875 RepID=UPI0035D9AAFC